LIGPDEESEQWVSAIARTCCAPHVVLRKERKGDHDVAITIPPELDLEDRTPVFVDDLISTGETMIEAIEKLRSVGAKEPVCVAVHGVLASGAYEKLLGAGAKRIVTANTISHESNAIGVSGLISDAIKDFL
jgi:ribose-phosphate pyrophosphokinase